MITRRKARQLALQALYSVSSSGQPIREALRELAQREKVPQEAVAFPLDLCTKCMDHEARLDALIEKAAQHWRLERIARIDHIILRMALVELLFFPDIPPKASIDEAIELARRFSTEKSAGFVNGLLDRIAREEGIIESSE